MDAVTDAAFTFLSQEIAAAKEALLELARTNPEMAWHPYELKTLARNGWSADVMSLALERLIDEGRLTVSGDLRVCLSE